MVDGISAILKALKNFYTNIKIFVKQMIHTYLKEKIDEKYLDEKQIEKKISDGLDIIGRKDSFKRIELSDKFPKFILKNKKNLKDWIID